MERKTTEEILPKKITWFDKLKNAFRKMTGFQEGSRFILDVKPKMKEYSDLELMKIATIEEKWHANITTPLMNKRKLKQQSNHITIEEKQEKQEEMMRE